MGSSTSVALQCCVIGLVFACHVTSAAAAGAFHPDFVAFNSCKPDTCDNATEECMLIDDGVAQCVLLTTKPAMGARLVHHTCSIDDACPGTYLCVAHDDIGTVCIREPMQHRIRTATAKIPTCFDMHGGCVEWATEGECDANPSFMNVECQRSCKICDGGEPCLPPPCEDSHDMCASWRMTGECHNNREWMSTNCPFSCDTC